MPKKILDLLEQLTIEELEQLLQWLAKQKAKSTNKSPEQG